MSETQQYQRYKWYGPAIWGDLLRVGLYKKAPKWAQKWVPIVRQGPAAEARLKSWKEGLTNGNK